MVFFTTPELLEIGGLAARHAVRQADAAGSAALLPPRRRHLRHPGLVSRGSSSRSSERTMESSPSRRRHRGVNTRDGTRARWCWRSATTICPTTSVCRAKICRTSRTTTPTRTRTTGSASSSSAERTRPPRRRSSCFAAGAHVTLVHRHADARRLDQVLGPARHREPHQGRLDRRALRIDASWRSRRPRSIIEQQGRRGGDSRRGRVPADRLSPGCRI